MTKVIAIDMISKTTISIPTDNEESIKRYVDDFKANNKLRKLIIIKPNGEEEIIINKESKINKNE